MKKILRIITNKFLLTGLAFFIWMAFFDQYDWIMQQQRKKELQVTRDNIAYLNTEIAKMEKEQADLSSNPAKLEQFAREQYRMKKDNEDLYVIEK